MLVARGTSDNAASFGRYLIEITTGIPVLLSAPSITTLYKAPLDLRDVMVVGISQSGESTDTNMVLEQARGAGACTVGITNEGSSSITRIVDTVLLVRAGREASVAATKTYTGQLLACYLLAYALGAPVSRDDLALLPARADSALRLEPEVGERAERYTFMDHAVTVARGLNYANAFEFALKLMETCYVVAQRFSSADLLHGPIAMVESSFPALLFTPAGVTWPGLKSLLEKLHSLKAETLVISDLSNRQASDLARNTIVLPMDLSYSGPLPEDVYTPIPYIIPAQLFAAHLADHKGINPDSPRTLSKVTRTL